MNLSNTAEADGRRTGVGLGLSISVTEKENQL
jgi:hypothetical protein